MTSFGSIRALPSGSFQARVSIDGIPHAQTFAVRDDAELWLMDLRRAKLKGQDVVTRTATIAEYGHEVLMSHRARVKMTTWETYRMSWEQHVVAQVGETKLSAMTRGDVRRWLDGLAAEGTSEPTMRKALRTLQLVLSSAVDDDLIAVSPAFRAKVPRVVGYRPRAKYALTPLEVRALDDAAPEHSSGFLFTLAYAALRWGECAALRPMDVDLTAGTVVIRRTALSEFPGVIQDETKRGRDRTVMLPQEACMRLQLAMQGRAPGDLIWQTPVARNLWLYNNWRRNVWQVAWRRLVTADPAGWAHYAHLEPVEGERSRLVVLPKPHDLRVTGGSWRVDALGLPAAQAELGHRSVTTTAGYTRKVIDDSTARRQLEDYVTGPWEVAVSGSSAGLGTRLGTAVESER